VLAIPISGVLMGLAMQTDAGMDPSAALTGSTLIFAAIYALYALATFIPSLAIAVRRLHDAVVQKIDARNASFWSARYLTGLDGPGLGLMERQRLKMWLAHAFSELAKAEP
jgi:uncharacterized membrane protein YhaH (DUF805 family)